MNKEATVSRHTFRNPGFMPGDCNHEYYRKHRTSGAAYELSALIKTCRLALEGDDEPTNRQEVGLSLRLAEHLAGDLIDACERLEAK